jgi:hypothetical protein
MRSRLTVRKVIAMVVASWTSAAAVGTITLCLWAAMAGTGEFLLARLGQNVPLSIFIWGTVSFVALLIGLRNVSQRWMIVLGGLCLMVIVVSSLPGSISVPMRSEIRDVRSFVITPVATWLLAVALFQLSFKNVKADENS